MATAGTWGQVQWGSVLWATSPSPPATTSSTKETIRFAYTTTTTVLSHPTVLSKIDSWTPVSSSVTFTSSAKLSRGGYGHLGDLLFHDFQGQTDFGSLYFKYFNFDAEVRNKTTYIFKSTLPTGNSATSYSLLSKTDTWTPVSSSANFTASAKASRGGYGHMGDLYRRTFGCDTTGNGFYWKTGTVKSVQGVVHSVVATIQGAATVTATGFRVANASATIIGSAVITADMTPTILISATITGQGVVTAQPTMIHNSPQDTITGAASVSATVNMIRYRTATLTGSASVTASAQRFNVADGWYESGATFSGGGPSIKLVQRFTSNEYLNGQDWIKLGAPFSSHRENNPSMTAYQFQNLQTFLAAESRLILPLASEAFVKFTLWDTVTSWPAESSFSQTLAGKTFRQSTSSSFTKKKITAVRRSPGTLNIAAIEMDGVTSVSFGAAAKWVGAINITGTTNWAFNPSQVKQTGWTGPGSTSVSITPKLYAGGPWEGDGSTSMSINTAAILETEIDMDGSTDFEIETAAELLGNLNITGATDVSITPFLEVGGPWSASGSAAMSIHAAQYYAGALSITGSSSLSITPAQYYAAQIDIDGVGSCNFNAIRQRFGSWTANGLTNVSFEAESAQVGNLSITGTTNVAITASALFEFSVQIVSTGVAGVSIFAEKGLFSGFECDGSTTWNTTGNVKYAGFLQIFTGIGTDVKFNASARRQGFINIGTHTDFSMATGTNQFGAVVVSQMDQNMSSIMSFILSASASWTSGSSMVPNSKFYPLGTDFSFLLVDYTLDNTDFTQIPSGSLTLSSKTSRSGWGDVGRMVNERAYGFSRADAPIFQNRNQYILREEWVKFPFFVDMELDFVEISDSFGFSATGTASRAGAGIIGRDEERYVTFSVLTNVFLTNANAEILATGSPNVRVTMLNTELIWIPTSAARMTQTVRECLYLANLAVINETAIESLHNAIPNALLNETAIEVLSGIHANALCTQIVGEMIATGNPAVDVTTVIAEVLTTIQVVSFSDAVIQECAIEAVHNADPNAVINYTAVEVINNGHPNAVIQESVTEAIHNSFRNALIQEVAPEALHNGIPHATINGLAVEILVRFEFDPEVAGLIGNPHYHI